MYLYGAGGHSKVITNVLTSNGVNVSGIFDDNPRDAINNSIDIQKGLHSDSNSSASFSQLEEPMIISIGDNERRAAIACKLPGPYGKAIHRTAIISPTAKIGDGTVILQGAIVQASAKIGKHVLINTAASIDHDNIIGDFAHISPHATLCGHVEIGEGTHVGAAAVVIPSIKIGRWCTIGAGAVIIRDVPDFATVVGNPGRVIKYRDIPEYLKA